MNLFFHKNYYYHLNNLFFFSNIKKNKANKKWFLYIYLNYLFNILFIYKKYIILFKKIKILKKNKIIFNNVKFRKKLAFIKKILRIKLLIKLFSFLKFLKIKIYLNKFKISFLFNLITKHIKNKILLNDNFKLIKFLKLKLWRLWKKKTLNKFYLYRKFKKIFKLKYRKKKIKKHIISNTSSNYNKLLLKIDLFVQNTYNMKFNELLFLYKQYSSIYNLKTFKDIFLLLDKKITYLMFNWFGLLKSDLDFFIKNYSLNINGYYLNHTEYIIQNGFIIDFKYKNNFFFKRLFYMFYIKPTFFNRIYINNYFFKFFKKEYINNVYFLKKNIICDTHVINYIYYFSTYTIHNSQEYIKKLNIYFFNKIINVINFKWIKFNIVITIKKNINFFSKYINHTMFFINYFNSLAYLGFYIKINFKKRVKYYIKNIKSNIFLKFKFLYNYLVTKKINFKTLFFKNIKQKFSIKKILYYLTNSNIYKFKIEMFFKNVTTSNILFFYDLYFIKKKYYLRKKSITTSSTTSFYNKYKQLFFFDNFFLIKNIKHILLNIITSIISYNYINSNNILNYKNLVLVYNLKNTNSFYNLNTKWLQIFNIEKKINSPVKKFL